MKAPPAPTLGRWSAVLAAALCVLLVPVLLALLAPPPLATDGPVFDAVTRDGCTAALDRVERLLSGALDVRLLEPTACGLGGWAGLRAVVPGTPVLAAAPEVVVALAARGSDAELRL